MGILAATGLSLYEFAFALVPLTLGSVGKMFHMKSRTRERAWLCFALLQVRVGAWRVDKRACACVGMCACACVLCESCIHLIATE